MSRLSIPLTLLALVMFSVIPGLIYAQESFVIDNFEGGMDIWSTGQGAGALPGSIEQIDGGHDGKGARVTMPAGEGWMIIRTANESLVGVDEGLTAFNMWVKEVVGSDQWIRIMFYGVGDISSQNRWVFDFKVPAGGWTLISTPLADIQPWRDEQRPFNPALLSFMAFVQEANPPLGGEQTTWKDIEFLVDDVGFGPLGGDTSASVQPQEKLPATWGKLKL